MSDCIGNDFNGAAAGDVSVIVAVAARDSPRIALFYADGALLAHVEAALAEAGVPVVCKTQVDQVDRASLAASGAAIALINLDDLCDDKLDALSAMLDAAGIPVVFNDAMISRGLDGWARARWARHLIAKLRGSVDVDPPRPAPPLESAKQVPGTNVLADSRGGARPLTQDEIESLLADFTSDSGDAGRDANALSAHVDALLANAADGAASGPAAWVAVAATESPAPPVHQEIALPFAAAASGPSAWELLDEPTVFSAPRESVPAPAAAITQTVGDFELEPIEHVVPALVREREFEEMRVEEVKSARRAEKNVKSAKRAGKVK